MPALTMDDGFIFNNKKNLPPIVSTMQNSHQPLSSLLALETIPILCQHIFGLFCPTHPLCKNKYRTEHQPSWHFPNPPTQPFWWCNIGMVPFKLTCLLPFFVTFLALRSIDKGCVTNSAQKPPNKMHNLTKIITINWNKTKVRGMVRISFVIENHLKNHAN